MSVQIKQASGDNKSVLTTTPRDDYTFQGKHFLMNEDLSFTSEEVKLYLLDFSSVPAGTSIILEPLQMSSESTNITAVLYEGTNYTGGTAVAVNDINRETANTPKTKITLAPTGTEKGTAIRTHKVFASSTFFGTTSGNKLAANLTILDPSKNYLIELTNEEASATESEFNNAFFEV